MPRRKAPFAKRAKKAVVAGVSLALSVLAAALTVGPEVIPEEALPWVQIALAVGGTYGVYQARNTETSE